MAVSVPSFFEGKVYVHCRGCGENYYVEPEDTVCRFCGGKIDLVRRG